MKFANTTNTTVSGDDLVRDFKENVSFANFVVMGLVIPLGLACNSLAFAVFVTSQTLKRTSTGNYLMALSIADWLFLLADLMRWMNTTSQHDDFYLGLNFMFTNRAVCKLTYFFRYGSKLTSAWITIAITTERLVSVRWPLHAHQLSTTKRAKIVIIAIFSLCFLLGSYPFWTVDVLPVRNYTDISSCRTVPGTNYKIWNTALLAAGSLIIPGLLMCCLTGTIIYSLAKSRQTRKMRLSCNADNRKASSHQNIERQLTLMLLSVAMAFVILRLPYTITYTINRWKLWHPLNDIMDMRLHAALKITDVIATTNYTINFVLYCLCGSAFRRQLRIMFSCKKRYDFFESKTYLMRMSTSSPGRSYSDRRVELSLH